MKLIIWIALKLRLRNKIWSDMFLYWHRKKINIILDSIDLDTKDIIIKRV